MSTPPSPPDAVHSEEFLRLLMRRQLKLSVACAAAFLVGLIGLPLLNYYAPALMATRGNTSPASVARIKLTARSLAFCARAASNGTSSW